MRHKISVIERYWLGLFPLLYGLLVFPAYGPAEVFVTPRLIALLVFLLVAIVLRLAVYENSSFAGMVRAFTKQPKYIYYLLGFLASVLVSTVFSASESASWFGDPALRNGSVFVFLCAACFWIYSSARNVPPQGLMILSVMMSVLTILEFLGFRPLALIIERHIHLTSAFPAVTVGQRGHLAGLLTFLSVLPLFWYRDRRKDRQFWSIFIINCIALGCTSNSSSYIGMGVVIMIYLFLEGRKMLVASLFIPLVAILGMSVFRVLIPLNHYLYDHRIVDVRSDSKNLGNDSTFRARIILWKAAFNMGVTRPIFGWGPQTFNNHWYNYISKSDGDRLFRIELGINENQKMIRINDSVAYKDEAGKTQPRQLNYIAPHSGLFELFYSQGILGIITMVLFLISLGYFLYSIGEKKVFIALLPALAYGIYLLGWFITVPTTGIICIASGMLISEFIKRNADIKVEVP